MQLYIKRNGLVTGPFMVFKIRDMLEDHECEPQDLAWHDGMESWKPLKEIEGLGFLPRPMAPEPAEGAAPLPPPPVPNWPDRSGAAAAPVTFEDLAVRSERNSQAWLRLGARVFDVMLFGSVLTGLMIGLGLMEVGHFVFRPVYWEVGVPVVWIFAEAWMLSQFGATPGKKLLSLRVEKEGGGRLSYGEALRRSFDVWLMGCAMFFSVVVFLAFGFGYARLRSRGRCMWEESSGSRVVRDPVSPWGLTALIFALLAYVGVQGALFRYAKIPASFPTDQREWYENLRNMATSLETPEGSKKETPAETPQQTPPGAAPPSPSTTPPPAAEDKPAPLPTL